MVTEHECIKSKYKCMKCEKKCKYVRSSDDIKRWECDKCYFKKNGQR